MIVRFYMVILCGTGIIIIQYGMWSLVTNWNGMTTCWKTCVTLSSGGSFLTCKKGLCTDSFCFPPKKKATPKSSMFWRWFSQNSMFWKWISPWIDLIAMDWGISAIFRQRQVWLYRFPRFFPYILPFTHLGVSSHAWFWMIWGYSGTVFGVTRLNPAIRPLKFRDK